ncbi:MAG: hypothetical protein ACT4OP_13385 [Actinomycetota bacterium]
MPFLDTRRPAHLPYVLYSLPRVIPVFLVGLVRAPRITWREAKLLMYVTEWRRYLIRLCRLRSGLLLMDQGPVYAMGRLEAHARPYTTSRPYLSWRRRLTATWARTLDHVVLLDAPDSTLLERINRRQQAHEAKGRSIETGSRFLESHRRAFDETLGRLAEMGTVDVRRMNSATRSPTALADEVIDIMSPAHRQQGKSKK